MIKSRESFYVTLKIYPYQYRIQAFDYLKLIIKEISEKYILLDSNRMRK